MLEVEATRDYSPVEAPGRCLHCGAPFLIGAAGADRFCCAGCANVYRFIHTAGLEHYYDMQEAQRAGRFGSSQEMPVVTAYLDDEEFAKRYLTELPSGLRRASFFLEGIHCAGCIWLLERLPELCPGVSSVNVSLPDSRLHVDFIPQQIPLSRIASVIHSLGYSAHPACRDDEEELRKKAERTTLLRLGVAAVCSMNTMLLAVSIYQGWRSGMDPQILRYFTGVSLLLSTPAVLYSAFPLYRTAYAGIRQKILHIDLPLSLAIVLGFLLSAWNTLQGTAEVYFDTVTMLIFLILGARYLQQRALNASAAHLSIFSALSPLWARRSAEGKSEDIYIENVRAGDVLEVLPGERFPVDGVILAGESSVDESLLTGESRWIPVVSGSQVFGGTRNCEGPVRMKAARSHSESRIGLLITRLEQAPRRGGRLIELSDRLSSYFVSAILVLAVIGGASWYIAADASKALSVVLALLVVSCPCALGLAAPLAYTNTLMRAARKGIFIREARLLERLRESRRIVFDKTGVLTETEFSVTSLWTFDGKNLSLCPPKELAQRIDPRLLMAILTVESQSQHLIAKGIARCMKDAGIRPMPLEEIGSIARDGSGIAAQIGSKVLLIGSAKFLNEKAVSLSHHALPPGITEETLVYVACDEAPRLIIGLHADIRDGAVKLCADLRSSGNSLFLLSGDRQEAVAAVAKKLEFSPESTRAEFLPEQKADFISGLERLGPVVMIGDGANDTAAIRAASVGIAVSGAADAAVLVAGISISPFSPEKLSYLISISKQMAGTIHFCFGLSVFYNVIAAAAALAGKMNPLLAAVLMPLSSFSVLIATAWLPLYQERFVKEGKEWR